MKLSTNQVEKKNVETRWDDTAGRVITTIELRAWFNGESAAQTAASLKDLDAIYLTLSSAPVRAVKRDAKPPQTGKRGRKPTQKPEAPPVQPQGQGGDGVPKPSKSTGPMVEMKPGARIGA